MKEGKKGKKEKEKRNYGIPTKHHYLRKSI